MKFSKLIAPLLALGTVIAAPALLEMPSAQVRADDAKENPLADAPLVRNRILLVRNRFEVTPAFEATVNAEFRHNVAGGLKLEYHISDMFSLGAVGFFGTSINTGLVKRIIDTLPENGTEGDPTPSKAAFEAHLNEMPIHGAAFIGVTPWYGKLAAFGSFFLNFDFYFQGGVSYAQLNSNCSAAICSDQNPGVFDPANGIVPDDNPNNDPPLNDGSRLGVYVGGGIHVFLNDWLALDFTVRDYIFSDNPSGLDFDADLAVTEDDGRFLNHLFMGLGVSIMLPFEAKRTN